MTQLPMFPELKADFAYKAITEQEAKQQTADLLETLLNQGFVNVKEEDVSEDHLKDLINTLRKE